MKSYRRQKIKLVKDLNEGQNNLCQSLVDIGQFQNIDEAFQKKKLTFNIPKRNVTIRTYTPISQQQAQYDMTPTQKIQFYKRRNIKQRYNQSSIEMLKKMFIRKSKIPNMLNNLKENMKVQVQNQFDKQIRRSQEKLKFYRSQGKLKEQMKNKSFFQPKNDENRCRFYSLKSGKPEINQKLFPTFQEYVEGKNRAKLQQKFEFDVSKIEKNLSTFYTQIEPNPEQMIQSSKNISFFSHNFTARLLKPGLNLSNGNISPVRSSQGLVLSQTQNFKKRQLIKRLDRYSQQCIQKSEKSSSKIVKTMSNFYKSKNEKKSQYNNMVQFYEHDRPLTNQIRRNQYLSPNHSQKIRQLNYYRNESQSKRLQILFFNSNTYLEILNQLSKYHEDDIPISLQILKGIRHLMKRQYIFGKEDVQKLLMDIKKWSLHVFKPKQVQPDEDQKQDFMIQPVIDILNHAYEYKFQWEKL